MPGLASARGALISHELGCTYGHMVQRANELAGGVSAVFAPPPCERDGGQR